MGRLVYSMGVSLDGFVAGPHGEIDWSAPDEELHRFHNTQTRELSLHLCGRRLYETMASWETAAERPGVSASELEFAGIWNPLPKLVFSTTLGAVEGNARLRRELRAEEIEELKRNEPGEIAVGGPGLASSLIAEGLVDEYRMFVSPLALGGGTPYFPILARPLTLRLLEQRTFGARVLYLRYQASV
jgi:dihydrofolate reductase